MAGDGREDSEKRERGVECRLDEIGMVGCISVVKTVVFAPDDVFDRSEPWVERLQTSHGQFCMRALAGFVARHAADRVYAAMNAVVAEVGPAVDEFTCEAARKRLRRVER